MGSGNGTGFGTMALGLCPMCFSTSAGDPQFVAATMAGVVVLLAVTMLVLGGVIGGIVSIARRGRLAAQMAAAIEQAHAPEGLRR